MILRRCQLDNVSQEEFLKTFRDYIERVYGSRCPDRASGCACCQMWALYDLTVVMASENE